MYVTRHIDWLSATFENSMEAREVFPLLSWRLVGRGLHGYTFKYQCKDTGATYEGGSADRSMGCHLTLSGEALAILRQDRGMQDHALVRHIANLGAKASRIDLTLNIREGLLTPRKIQSAIKSGAAKAKANVSRFIEGKSGDVAGDTFYIGAPSSDRQFRAYNKTAQLGMVDGASWLRLELELRRLRANGAFQSVATNGVDATITGHMADFLNWGDVEYQTALSGKSLPPDDIPRRASNRRRWLTGQVAQALAKEMMLDDEFANVFWSHVNMEYDTLKKRLTNS